MSQGKVRILSPQLSREETNAMNNCNSKSLLGEDFAKKFLRENFQDDRNTSLLLNRGYARKTTNNNFDELSRMQKDNITIMKMYITMHPVTLQFNNSTLERDYLLYFAHKRQASLNASFLALAVLSQFACESEWRALVKGKPVQSFARFSVVQLVCTAFVLLFCIQKKMIKFRSSEGNSASLPFVAQTPKAAETGLSSLDDYFLFAGMMLVCLVYISFEVRTTDNVCNAGFLFAAVFITVITSRMRYLLALALQAIISVTYIALDPPAFSGNHISMLFCVAAITWTLRSLEVGWRRDFRLTRRLAAENVDVKVDMTTRSWFESGRAKVVPSAMVSPAPSALSEDSGILEPRTPVLNDEIQETDIALGKAIGTGSFGTVFAGRWRGTDVAVKRAHGELDQASIVEFGRETAILSLLRHPNIVMYLGVCTKPLMLVMELMPRGSLYDLLHLNSDLELHWSLRLRMLNDAARGMTYLHSADPPVHHNDLKSLNLLVDNDYRIKVSDFNFSKLRYLASAGDGSETDQNPVSTLGWASPESIGQETENSMLGGKNDVYAFAIVIFEVFTRTLPFSALGRESISLAVLSGKRPDDFLEFQEILEKQRLSASNYQGKAILEVAYLMREAWQQEPKKRPNFEQVLEQLLQITQRFFQTDSKSWEDAVIFPIRGRGSSEKIEALQPKSSGRLEFIVNPKDLKLGPCIGKGAYGAVYEAVYHGTHVAVKQMFESHLSDSVRREFEKEVNMLCSLRHPNIVLFMGCWSEPPKLLIVMELMVRGSLHSVYRSNKKPEREKHMKLAHKISEGMLLALNYLHNHTPQILHRDMKSPNIMLDEGWNAKVGDFGLSRIKEEGKVMTSVGSPLWCAPETLRGEESGSASDVYSFAIIVWEILAWSEPYVGMGPAQIMRKVALHGLRPQIPQDCPADLEKLLQDCWKDNPAERPSLSEIISRSNKCRQA